MTRLFGQLHCSEQYLTQRCFRIVSYLSGLNRSSFRWLDELHREKFDRWWTLSLSRILSLSRDAPACGGLNAAERI